MGPTLDLAGYLDVTSANTARVVSLTRDHPDVAVPTCGDWTIRMLAGHLGAIQRWAAHIVANRLTERHWERDEPPANGVDTWLAASVERLRETFAGLDGSEPVWGWAGDGTTAFWARRMAHESLVHRLDAELAVGERTPVDPDLASDAVDELLDVLVQVPRFQDRFVGRGELIHLHRTDGDGEWLLRLGEDGIGVAHEHSKGDAAARGGALALLLYLWGRTDTADLETFGDAALLESFPTRIPL